MPRINPCQTSSGQWPKTTQVTKAIRKEEKVLEREGNLAKDLEEVKEVERIRRVGKVRAKARVKETKARARASVDPSDKYFQLNVLRFLNGLRLTPSLLICT